MLDESETQLAARVTRSWQKHFPAAGKSHVGLKLTLARGLPDGSVAQAQSFRRSVVDELTHASVDELILVLSRRGRTH